MRTANLVLRVVALLGTVAVLLQQAWSDFPPKPRQEYFVVVLLLALLAVGLTFLGFMRFAAGRLLRHLDLLVPIGLVTTIEGVLGWLVLLPAVAAVMNPAWPLQLWTLSLSLSLGFVVNLALWVAYGAWMTTLIVHAVRHDRVDLLDGLRGAGRWFVRVLGLEFIGWGVLFVGIAVAIALGQLAVPLAFLVIGVSGLVWNLMTVALLPAALDERLSFGQSLRQGIRASLTGMGRWGLLVLVQLLLLGIVTYIHISYTVSPGPGSVTTHTKTN
jgi:hypothetical protein